MAFPQPVDPDEDEPASTENPAAGASKSPPRPDWLVGADEALSTNTYSPPENRRELPKPTPTIDDSERPKPAQPSFAHLAPRPSQPTPLRIKPPSGDPAVSMFESPNAWMTKGSAASRPHPVSDEAAEAAPPAADPIGDGEAAPPRKAVYGVVIAKGTPQTAPQSTPQTTPWWEDAVARVRSDRRVQLLIAGIAFLIVLVSMTAHESTAVPISRIKRHPQTFDGQVVTVRGRVGEVFVVGGGYAFYLIQGRDSIAVFTRLRPGPRRKLEVTGSVSTGYLEGVPRPALFEVEGQSP